MQSLKKTFWQFIPIAALLCVFAGVSLAQGAGRGPIAEARDPEMERTSRKSLDAAKFYFYKRKPHKEDKDGAARAKKSILDRLNEIVDTNVSFAQMDEVYFLMAEVHARDNQTEEANKYYSLVVKEFPDSQHHAEAKRKLGVTVEAKAPEKNPVDKSKPEKKG